MRIHRGQVSTVLAVHSLAESFFRLVGAAESLSQSNTIAQVSMPICASLSEDWLPPEANTEQRQALETAMALFAEV
jgi:hypothetical protein